VTGTLRSLGQRRASCDIHDWDGRVAREVARQARIEAAFDRADAFYSVGDFEPALEWLQTAEALAGELPPAYRMRRAEMEGE
jgi:hypothetical protein